MSSPFSYGPPGGSAGPPRREQTRPRPLPTNTNATVHELLQAARNTSSVPGPAFIRTSVTVPTNRHCSSRATQLLLPSPQYLQPGIHCSSSIALNPFNLLYGQRQCYDAGPPPIGSWPRTSVIYALPPSNASSSSPMTPSQARSSEQVTTDGPDKSKKPSSGRRKNTAPHKNNAGQHNFVAMDRKLIQLDASGAPLTCQVYYRPEPSVAPLNYSVSPGFGPGGVPVSAPAPAYTGLPKMEHLSSSSLAKLLQEPKAQGHIPQFNQSYFAGSMQNFQAEPLNLGIQNMKLPSPPKPSVTNPPGQECSLSPNPPIISPPKKRKYNSPTQPLNESYAPIPIKMPEAILPGPASSPIAGQTVLGPGPVNNISKKRNNGTEGNKGARSRSKKPGTTGNSVLSNHPADGHAPVKFDSSFNLPGPSRPSMSNNTTLPASTQNSAPESNPTQNPVQQQQVPEEDKANMKSNFVCTFQNMHPNNSNEKMFTTDMLKMNPFTKETPFRLGSSRSPSKSSAKSSYRPEFNVRATREDKKFKFSKADTANGGASKYSSFKSKKLESKTPKEKSSRKSKDANKESTSNVLRNCSFSAFPNLSTIGVGGHFDFLSPMAEFRHSTVVRKAYAVHTGTGKLKLLNEPMGPGFTAAPFHPVNDLGESCERIDTQEEEKLDKVRKPNEKLKKPTNKKISKKVHQVLDDNSKVPKSLPVEPEPEPTAAKPKQAINATGKDGFNVRWCYNDEELKELYKHNAFVVRRTDLSFYVPIEQHYNIYRLIMKDGLILLQKYIPVEDEEQNRIFHYSTNKCLRFEKIGAKFYLRYQPVYYGVCYGTVEDPNIVHVMWRKKIMQTLKFVFELNPLVGDFMNSLEIICCQVLNMKEIERILNEDDSHPGKESFVKLTKIIDDLSSKIYSHSRWNQSSVEIVKPWPKLWMGNKKEEDKEMSGLRCDICVPTPLSGPRNFWKRANVSGVPYDRVHHNQLEGNWKLPEMLKACCTCAEVLVTAHRVYHLKNDIFGCIVTILNDRLKSEPDIDGNELKNAIMNHDMGHWSREMFLDFCIVLGDGHKALERMHREANAIKAKLKVSDDHD